MMDDGKKLAFSATMIAVNEPLMLVLSWRTIGLLGDRLDEMYPGVRLYENTPIGQPAKFIRVLGSKT